MTTRAVLGRTKIVRSWWNKRRLIDKFTVVLVVVGLVAVPFTFVGMNALLAPTFSHIEEKQVLDQSKRARHALEVLKQTLRENVLDYAVWDDAFAYVKGQNPAFEVATLQPNAYQNMGIDVQAYVTNDGIVRWSKSVDRESGTVLGPETRFFGAYASEGRFFTNAVAKDAYADFVRTDRGLFMIQSHKIVRSDESGPSPGFVAMAVLLDAATLSEALQVKVDLDPDPSEGKTRDLLRGSDYLQIFTREDHRTTRMGLVDATGDVVGIVEYDTPRNASLVGRKTIVLATLGVVAVIVLTILLVAVCIRQIAVARLLRLESQVARMRNGDFEISDDLVDGGDEIAALARQFVDFDKELDAANAKLGRTAYLQGKADTASGMLHNVRNSLAPLRVLQERWLAEEREAFRLNMERAVEELDDPECDVDRRASLQRFLVTAATEIARGGEKRRASLSEAKKTIDQIAAILGSFDFNTAGETAREVFDPLPVIQHEARLLVDERFAGIEIEIPQTMPIVCGNRLQFGQVIGNLLVNAAEAILIADPKLPRIVVKVQTDNDEQIRIQIVDNGDGIAASELARVFERGYSTRQHKAGGLGMHWSAIAARSMGGNLAIASDGKGLGATVTVTLPRGTARMKLAA